MDTHLETGNGKGRTDPEALARRIPDWGTDADDARRPGVPREGTHALAAIDWPLAQQPGGERVLHPPDSPRTRVFGTAQPLRPFRPSSWLRRRAFRIPQDKAAHWMLLLVADRADVWEHRVGPMAALGSAAGAVALAVRASKPGRPRRRRARRTRSSASPAPSGPGGGPTRFFRNGGLVR